MTATITVEDGTARVDANSYNSVIELNTYFADRGVTSWAALSDSIDKIPAMLRATDYMLRTFRLSWQGSRVTLTQALDWPRLYVTKFDFRNEYYGLTPYYNYNEIPPEIKQAHAELTLRALTVTLDPDMSADDNLKRIKIGPIDLEYMDRAPSATFYRTVIALLSPFFISSGNGAMLVRR